MFCSIYRSRSGGDLGRWVCAALLLGSAGLVGCRSNANQVAQAPNPLAPGAAATTAANPWQPVPTATAPNTPFARLADVLNREQEQSRLAAEQRSALSQLAEWQKMQQEQMNQLAQQRQGDAMRKLQNQAELVREQSRELEHLAELRRRALELDANNRELHSQLAQTEQQKRVLEDQTQLMQQQLGDTANQLQSSLAAQQDAEQRVLQIQQDADRQMLQAQSGCPAKSLHLAGLVAAPRQRHDNGQQQSAARLDPHQHCGTAGPSGR